MTFRRIQTIVDVAQLLSTVGEVRHVTDNSVEARVDQDGAERWVTIIAGREEIGRMLQGLEESYPSQIWAGEITEQEAAARLFLVHLEEELDILPAGINRISISGGFFVRG